MDMMYIMNVAEKYIFHFVGFNSWKNLDFPCY